MHSRNEEYQPQEKIPPHETEPIKKHDIYNNRYYYLYKK